jgi:hypothetical protein
MIAAVGVFTNRKMGDVFSFLDSFLVILIMQQATYTKYFLSRCKHCDNNFSFSPCSFSSLFLFVRLAKKTLFLLVLLA